MSKIADITTEQQFTDAITQQPTVAHFWASWCGPCKQINALFTQFADKYPALSFVKVEAENLPDLANKYSVTSVPTVSLFLKGKVVGTVEGANPPEITRQVESLAAVAQKAAAASPVPTATATAAATKVTAAAATTDLNSKLKAIINSAPVMLFMKGTPSDPKCGFSSKITEILQRNNIVFGHFNILADEEVRQGLKTLSNWPTYPQLYANGALIGGLDIVKELEEQGELVEALRPAQEADLNTRLASLVCESPVMLFMKGTPDAPRCGFSSQIVALLRRNNVAFGSFDILTDEAIRNGLKTFSNWPTYPQLYAKGQLVGGLDVAKELEASGDLLAELDV